MNILIIGGGLCGILVSALLRQQGVAHALVESGTAFTGSRASSGILNPVMGPKRQWVADYDVLFPACKNLYTYLEDLLSTRFFHPVSILEFINGDAAFDFFREKALSYPEFLYPGTLTPEIQSKIHIPAQSHLGITASAYVLDMANLQKQYLSLLHKESRLFQTHFDSRELQYQKENFLFRGATYTHLVYCNGKDFRKIPEISGLPLAANKGQALLIDLADKIPRNQILKFGKCLTLCPYGESYWWAGASFEWDYETELPTTDFFRETYSRIQQHLKGSFRVVEALSGFRVSSTDRRAVAGWVPQNPRIGLLNAMGTKGVLQAPRAATELVKTLLYPDAEAGLFKLRRFTHV